MKKIRVAIAGAGSRGKDTYAPCAERYAADMELVAVADPREENRNDVRDRYGLAPENCFASAEEMLSQPKLADVMFICTMDAMHVPHAMAALQKGYDVMLEKPIGTSLEDCVALEREAKRLGRKVVVCHVLRYTPFYQCVKRIMDSGELGRIVSIQTNENVGYYHYAHSFVRGNWRDSGETSPMILAKCCHDLDIFLWLSGKRCKSVTSIGDLTEFKAENAPAGSSMRCLDGKCTCKADCPFDAEKIYLDRVRRGELGWPTNVFVNSPTVENVTEALKTGPYGRCVYHCDNNVVDFQTVSLQLEDGVIATLNMSAYSNQIYRQIKVMGTRGELEGDMISNKLRVWAFGKEPRVVDVNELADDLSGHGGGDVVLVRDVLDLLQGKEVDTNTLTSIDVSVESHVAAFAAEMSRLHGGEPVDLQKLTENS